MQLLRSGRNTKAMEVFALNQREHPDNRFWTSLGLARGYTAVGDKKNAIASWEIVLQNVPPDMNGRIRMFQAALKKLKESK